MTKREAARRRKHRLAQIDRAFEARLKPRMSERELRALYKERDRQTRLAQEEYLRGVALKPKLKPKLKTRLTPKLSRFWKHFGQDGLPVSPWETEAGPHVEESDDGMDESLFAEGDYGYEDFDVDWGGYDYEDTGYADEDA